MKSIFKTNLILIISIFFAGSISVLSLIYANTPYIWIGLIWFFLSLFYAQTSQKSCLKVICINASAIIFTFTAFEAYFCLKKGNLSIKPKIKSEIEENYITGNDILGYGPNKNVKAYWKTFYNNVLINNVTYTIGENGLRISPKNNDIYKKNCALFFGCSFTIGAGVHDNEAMPYRVGLKTQGTYQVYNFGFHGYGPHQMLSGLEHGVVEKAIKCKGKKIAIYQALLGHINRAAGLSTWDVNGPWYVRKGGSKVKHAGHFSDKYVLIHPRIIKQLMKSLVFQNLFGIARQIHDNDIELFTNIINTSKKKFKEIYPIGEFHVILWDNTHSKAILNRVVSDLNKFDIKIHFISDIIPDYSKNRKKYVISKYDGHPSPLAHDIIANYVVKTILNEEIGICP